MGFEEHLRRASLDDYFGHFSFNVLKQDSHYD